MTSAKLAFRVILNGVEWDIYCTCEAAVHQRPEGKNTDKTSLTLVHGFLVCCAVKYLKCTLLRVSLHFTSPSDVSFHNTVQTCNSN